MVYVCSMLELYTVILYLKNYALAKYKKNFFFATDLINQLAFGSLYSQDFKSHLYTFFSRSCIYQTEMKHQLQKRSNGKVNNKVSNRAIRGSLLIMGL